MIEVIKFKNDEYPLWNYQLVEINGNREGVFNSWFEYKRNTISTYKHDSMNGIYIFFDVSEKW